MESKKVILPQVPFLILIDFWA